MRYLLCVSLFLGACALPDPTRTTPVCESASAICADAGTGTFISHPEQVNAVRRLGDTDLVWHPSLNEGRRCYLRLYAFKGPDTAFVTLPESWCEGLR